jgi:hypothetical protein
MNRPGFSEDNNVVAWLILGYLCSHPDAKDTAIGVGKWWLRAEGVEAEMECVFGALDYLAERGWITSTGGNAGLKVYGLNQTRKAALQQFLQIQRDDRAASWLSHCPSDNGKCD